uniref:Peptidase M24 domain-containing protein n=1 Tax=Romanomermis culicivorax TaxID=13658 RepID=A0A915HZB5_ROMCU
MSSRDSSPSDSESENESKNESKYTPANDLVVTKHNMAAAVVNAVLQEIFKKCLPGQSVLELCEFGDKQLTEKTGQLFKKDKEMKKGIAFPTCISVNNCICHYSPLRSEKDVHLSAGDVVKVDLGAHVDGYIASAAHTIVIDEVEDQNKKKITGRKADVILAAHNALETAIRMLKPGQYKNNEITDVIQKIAENGEKQIIQNPGEKQKQDFEKCEFEQYEVYAIDILMSTGEDYPDRKIVSIPLKMKASRVFFSDVDKRFGSLPFTLRIFDDEVKTKMGVVECERHNLMKPFPVLYEKNDEIVAQMKATVLIMPSGILRITTPPNDPTTLYESEHKIQDEKILQITQSSLKQAKKKNKKSPINNIDESKKVVDKRPQEKVKPGKLGERQA